MRQRIGAILLAANVVVLGATVAGSMASADHDVEHRIAQFWQRIDALKPTDYVSSGDLGQWALNVIDRDARARLTVVDFRAATAAMQAAFDRAGPAPAVAAATPVPTPASTQVAYVTFGGGTKIVGVDVPAGTYRMRAAPISTCYFSRLSGFGGTTDDIITNAFGSGHAIVTIAPTDRGFESSGCGTWTTDLSAVTANPGVPFGGGMFIIGVDVSPGTWQSNGTGTCYWSRLSGFGGTLSEIIANDLTAGGTVVTMAPTDVGFTNSGCGTWTKIG